MSERVECVVRLARCGSADVPTHDEWLVPAERAVLAGFAVEKRRADWRLGRWCAKQAVVAVRGGEPADLEILAADDGAPEVRVPGAQAVITGLSLTHRDGRAAAVSGPVGLRIGCDLERVEPRSEAFIRDYFTGDEAAVVLDHAGVDRAVLANLYWSAKESALKAERTGLRADSRTVVVTRPTSLTADRWHALEVRGAARGGYSGWWRLDGEWLLTVLADRPHRLHGAHSVF